jgi:hypothetical protein
VTKSLSSFDERAKWSIGVARICDGLEEEVLEDEIFSEIASALGRTEKKLLSLLADLSKLAARIDGSKATRGVRPMIERFNRLREQAKRALWELVVHREAIGATNHRELDHLYPIPSKRRERVSATDLKILPFPLSS